VPKLAATLQGAMEDAGLTEAEMTLLKAEGIVSLADFALLEDDDFVVAGIPIAERRRARREAEEERRARRDAEAAAEQARQASAQEQARQEAATTAIEARAAAVVHALEAATEACRNVEATVVSQRAQKAAAACEARRAADRDAMAALLAASAELSAETQALVLERLEPFNVAALCTIDLAMLAKMGLNMKARRQVINHVAGCRTRRLQQIRAAYASLQSEFSDPEELLSHVCLCHLANVGCASREEMLAMDGDLELSAVTTGMRSEDAVIVRHQKLTHDLQRVAVALSDQAVSILADAGQCIHLDDVRRLICDFIPAALPQEDRARMQQAQAELLQLQPYPSDERGKADGDAAADAGAGADRKALELLRVVFATAEPDVDISTHCGAVAIKQLSVAEDWPGAAAACTSSPMVAGVHYAEVRLLAGAEEAMVGVATLTAAESFCHDVPPAQAEGLELEHQQQLVCPAETYLCLRTGRVWTPAPSLYACTRERGGGGGGGGGGSGGSGSWSSWMGQHALAAAQEGDCIGLTLDIDGGGRLLVALNGLPLGVAVERGILGLLGGEQQDTEGGAAEAAAGAAGEGPSSLADVSRRGVCWAVRLRWAGESVSILAKVPGTGAGSGADAQVASSGSAATARANTKSPSKVLPAAGAAAAQSSPPRSSALGLAQQRSEEARAQILASDEFVPLKRNLRALSYGIKGQDPRKLFAHYDRDNSGELEFGEFRNAVRKGGHVGASVCSDAQLRKLFSAVDTDGSGEVEVTELTNFIWGNQNLLGKHGDHDAADHAAPPPEDVAEVTHGSLAMPTAADRERAFQRIDLNSNGILSLAEIDKAVIEIWPEFNHKQVLMRAYKAADVNQNGLISRDEFPLLLKYLVYFDNLWEKFAAIDKDGDHQLNVKEFHEGAQMLGLGAEHGVTWVTTVQEFGRMDEDGGGYVRFDEFCAWCARKAVAVAASSSGGGGGDGGGGRR
jgi:Ca2+-binding EF-hand superfamily protein